MLKSLSVSAAVLSSFLFLSLHAGPALASEGGNAVSRIRIINIVDLKGASAGAKTKIDVANAVAVKNAGSKAKVSVKIINVINIDKSDKTWAKVVAAIVNRVKIDKSK